MSKATHNLETARQRLAVLQQWWKVRQACHRGAVNGRLNRFLAALERPVSRATLYNWERQYRGGGLAGLADRRSTRGRGIGPFVEAVVKLRSGHPPVALCYKLACLQAVDEDWVVPSYREVCRHLERLAREGGRKMGEGTLAG